MKFIHEGQRAKKMVHACSLFFSRLGWKYGVEGTQRDLKIVAMAFSTLKKVGDSFQKVDDGIASLTCS